MTHFTSTAYKLFIHIQAIVLVSPMDKKIGPPIVMIISGSKNYLSSIPIFILFILTIFSIGIICNKFNKQKKSFTTKTRIYFLAVLLLVTITQVAAYIGSFSDLSERPYYMREIYLVILSVVFVALTFCTLVVANVVMAVASRNQVIPRRDTGPYEIPSRGESRSQLPSVTNIENNNEVQRIELNLDNRPTRQNQKTNARRGTNHHSNLSPDNQIGVLSQLPPIDPRAADRGATFTQLAETAKQHPPVSENPDDDDSDVESVNFVTKQGSDRYICITQNDLKHMIQYKPTLELNSMMQDKLESPAIPKSVIKVKNLTFKEFERRKEATKLMVAERKAKLMLPRLESMDKDFDVDIISPKKIIENRAVLPVQKEMTDIKKLEITLKMFELLDKKNQEITDHRACQLCCEKNSDIVFQPCGHSGICFDCFLVMIEHHNVQCFYCRQDIEKIYKIDISKTYKDIFRVIDCFKIESQ